MENAHDGHTDSCPHLIRSPYDVCVLCAAATLDDWSPNQVGAGRVRGPGQIGMLISICDEGCEAGGAEGRANDKDAIGIGKSRRGKEEEFVWRSACGNCARRSTMELCAWALEFLVILVIKN